MSIKSEDEIVQDIIDYHKYCTLYTNEEKKNDIDSSKLNYNYYNTIDFWADKFPKEYKECIFMKPVIKNILEEHLKSQNTPLKEITAKSQQN
jgi:hypothetical protein